MLTITVDDSAFRSYLAELADRLGDLTPVMESIGQRLETRISARFETESDPAGVPWAPWSPAYAANYPKDGNRRILDRYGSKVASLLGSLSWEADSSSVRVGFGQDYSTFHEFGTKRMPRRGLLFEDPEAGTLAPDDEQAVLDLLLEWLDGADGR